MLDNNLLDVFGQQPYLYKLYTQICCIFPVTDSSSYDAIVDILTNGLDRLSQSFPWLAGEVINEGASEGNTGFYRIVPLPKIPLVVKDLQHDASMPTIETLRQANFPISMLGEEIIAPCMTLNLPGSSIGLASDSAPVFCVQANFIAGGLMLTIVGQHNSMDWIGQAQIIHLFSKACHNEPFTEDELSSGNMDRTKVIPLLDGSYEPGPELARQIVKPSPDGAVPQAPPKSTWAYITFSADSLAALKSRATETITSSSGFVSKDDSVSAFIWQCICRARISRLGPSTKATFARAVDVRQRLGVPSTYPGVMQNMTYYTDTQQNLADAPLGAIASGFRSALDPKTLAYNTRALATLLSRSPDKTIASVTASINIPTDFMLSSWAKIDCYDLDFNLGLGKPEAVRRPQFTPFESLGYLMPKSPAGEMAAAICLRDEDWERLKADEEFVKYAAYVG